MVGVLAFADDLLILDDDENNVPLTLRAVDRFLWRRGVEVNAAKCHAIY